MKAKLSATRIFANFHHSVNIMTHFAEITTTRNEGGLLSDVASAKEVAIIAIVGVSCFFAGAVFGRMSVPETSSRGPVPKPQQMVYGRYGRFVGTTANITPALAIHPDYSAKQN
jgi:hypothetical protein